MYDLICGVCLDQDFSTETCAMLCGVGEWDPVLGHEWCYLYVCYTRVCVRRLESVRSTLVEVTHSCP